MNDSQKLPALLDQLASYLRDTEECECEDEGTCAFCVAGEAQDVLEKMKKEGASPGPDVYTVEAGRNIYRNGHPLISIQRGAHSWSPSDTDDLTHVICALLNERQPKSHNR